LPVFSSVALILSDFLAAITNLQTRPFASASRRVELQRCENIIQLQSLPASSEWDRFWDFGKL